MLGVVNSCVIAGTPRFLFSRKMLMSHVTQKHASLANSQTREWYEPGDDFMCYADQPQSREIIHRETLHMDVKISSLLFKTDLYQIY